MRIISLIFLATTLLLAACNDHEDSPGNEPRRTVLIYMAAQNSLGLKNYHRSDSAEVMNGRHYVSNSDCLLMFIDDARAPRLYRVTKSSKKPELIRTWDADVCSTDPQTLTDVLQYVSTKFPSREYGLVMWSHADGWIPATDTDYSTASASTLAVPSLLSFGIDNGPEGNMGDNGPQMDVADMASAISAAGWHCKFIFFDACLMQNLEVAYALRDVTDYVVASPAATPGAGSYYTHNLRRGFFSADPADIARTYLLDVTSDELQSVYSDYGLAISCIETSKLQAVADALRDALPHSAAMNHESVAMDTVLNYQAYTSYYIYRPHNYDARQALRALLPEEWFTPVAEALDAAVTYHGATETFWIGPTYYDMQQVPVKEDNFRAVSMFVPQDIYTMNAQRTRHGDLNEAFRSTEWYRAAGWEQTGW